ncbi:sodium channel, non-voltage-gated 1, gamma [Schistosoma haematobium]|uniref:Sodium channel, non-voltage-gated 1, gamma n=2 Tax=Schistosoma haematobium TaxID=6185 RepID=A0A922INQ0_SCHHA|nr:sodium channel, non-voltage-gated 1, gamma [Schistosoma haematobium]KAH9583601.1 sodium channel, non-voltage-gated 1, gamma [Schistosoma haematobium]CAH8566487.1 unnamed protein product [Schistosoma curassoni]CAH8576119.1 unnamed protein product [Schistosoma haematobium]CAH8583336.1 unnamed protein product [Schistosoma haematobium]
MTKKSKKLTSKDESQLRKDLKKEFLHFCQTTTIRGVTRVVTARNKTLQILWIASVILFFGGLFVCMFILTRQYLEYNVIHPPQVLRDTPSPFPSLTLCNLRPLSSEANSILNKYNLKSPRQFAIDVNNFAAKAYYFSNDIHSYQQVTSAVSMGGYLESLPQIVVPKLGHNLSHTVIHCMVIHAEGSKRVMNECIQVGRWRRFVHAQYLNCYTYDIHEIYRNHVRTIELFVYLDESMNITSCSDCFSSEIKSQLSGAVVTVHNAETYPDINQEGINIQPGSLTEIKVKTIKHTQKTPPYGRCSPDTPTKIHLYGSEVYAYSEHACRMSTIQAKINSLCGCNAIEFPYINESLPFCLEMSSFVKIGNCDIQHPIVRNYTINNSPTTSNQNHTLLKADKLFSVNQNQETKTHEIPFNFECLSELEAVKNRVLCKSEVTKHYQGDVVLSCTLPCAFFAYETDRSTSTWPTKSWQLSWLSTRAGKKVANRPDLVGYRLAKERLDASEGEKEAQEFLAKSNVLERNLLAIMLIRPNFNVHKVDEKEVLSLTSLLSQSGGLFSIWIGLNMMSVIEVVELIFHLITKCRQFSKRKRLRRTQKKQTTCDTLKPLTNANSETEMVQDQITNRGIGKQTEKYRKDDMTINNGPIQIHTRKRSPSAPNQMVSGNISLYLPQI